MNSTQIENITNHWHIFFIWEGNDIPLFAIKNIETFLYFNPTASIRLYSTTLPANNIHLSILYHWMNFKYILLNISELTKKMSVSQLVQVISKRIKQNKKNAVVHFSDLLRVLILFIYGGTYFDTDICCLQPLDKNFWLTDAHLFVDFNGSYVCGPNIYINISTYFSCLCNGLMSFKKSHPFLNNLLNKFSRVYNPSSYITLGAPNFMDIFYEKQNLNGFTFSPNPCSSGNITKNHKHINDALIEQIKSTCPVFHFFNSGNKRFAKYEVSKLLKLQILPHNFVCSYNYNENCFRIFDDNLYLKS